MADITLSDAELLALPPTVPVALAGRAWGLGRSTASELGQADEFPCPVVRVGKRYRVNRAALYAALDFDPVVAAQRLAAAAASTGRGPRRSSSMSWERSNQYA